MNRVVGTLVFSTFTLQGLFSFFYFLFFARTKSTKTQNKQFHPITSLYARFVSWFWLVTCFCFFVRAKPFCKKKIK